MSSKQVSSDSSIRPTKKQRDLLDFIEKFIEQHGYSPSYREIMNGLAYTSVATVALHVNSLITRGHLRKRDRSARSLEVVRDTKGTASTQQADPRVSDGAGARMSPEDWLLGKVEERFVQAERAPVEQPRAAGSSEKRQPLSAEELQKLDALVVTLEVLGMEDKADAYAGRLEALAGHPGDLPSAG